jgi:diguanylate cyclase (GGDEF)-like protein
MIAVSVALTGGPKSSAICWFAVPAVTLGARFERRGVILGLAYLLGLLLLSTVAVDPSAAAARPDFINFPVALTLAVTVFSAAIVQSDRHHRLEAVVDPLTGLLNRTALYPRFGELRQQAQMTAGGSTVGFLVVDLDHFKRINDEHGHAFGDEVLRIVADALRRDLREIDLPARLGGEEFAVLLTETTLEGGSVLAERLRETIARLRIRVDGKTVRVTASFGVATFPETASGKSLLLEADRALYRAKALGKNRVVAARPTADSQ